MLRRLTVGRITEWRGEHAAIVDHHVNYIDKLARYEDIGEIGEIVPILRSHWVYKDRHRKSYRRYTGLDDFGEKHTITVKVESKGKELYCANCGAQAAESFLDFCPKCGAYMHDDDEGG